MPDTKMEIVLSTDLKSRLVASATADGKSLNVFIQEALYTYVEDMEDGAMSDVALSEEGLVHLLPERENSVVLDH